MTLLKIPRVGWILNQKGEKKDKNLAFLPERISRGQETQNQKKTLVSRQEFFLPPVFITISTSYPIASLYFAHNGYFFRRQGTHITRFFLYRARPRFASEVSPRVYVQLFFSVVVIDIMIGCESSSF
jgi:hypothetical protein